MDDATLKQVQLQRKRKQLDVQKKVNSLKRKVTVSEEEPEHFHASFSIYQFGRERKLQSDLTSGLSSCMQIWVCGFAVQHSKILLSLKIITKQTSAVIKHKQSHI